MRILVDADACPVKKIIESIGKEYGATVVFYIDSSHILHSEYGLVKQVEQGKDSVDLALINDAQTKDIVVTQDYGVASMALGKGAFAMGNSGLIYDKDNIEKLMFERFLHQKIRRAGKRGTKLAHLSKRTKEDDRQFEESLRRLCQAKR